MNHPRDRLPALLPAGLVCLLWLGSAAAQDAPAAAPAAAGMAPTPWYIGASQGFTHESNVYRVPAGPGDTYSSTNVFGGFDQRISRQRVFGTASVGLNRYFDQKQLNNTSYDLGLGLDWETAGNLSGDLDFGLRQRLAAPAASAGVPATTKNLGKTQTVDGLARWGGSSLLTLEGAAHYSSLDYSAPEYISAESSGTSGSLTLYYRSGGPLRLGIGARVDRTRTPNALFDAMAGTYEANTERGRNLDFLADYDLTGQLTANLRLSYTRQTNSLADAADFSGLTGRLAMSWRATGKLSFNGYASRDSGFDSAFGSVPVVQLGAPEGTPPVTRLFENNRITYAGDLGATYAATAKIDVTAGGHYTRAHLVSTSSGTGGTATDDTTDVLKSVYLAANYNILRNWSASCRLARELRSVSGGVTYSYDSNSIGCSTKLTYR
jgi:hypothetical protein